MDVRLPPCACLALSILALACAIPSARAEDADSAAASSSEVGKVELHGYGDFQYSNPKLETMSRGASNEIDVHGFELGWEYGFTPALHLEAEVDFEHAASDIELEEAMLEYDLSPTLSLRMGSLLMPVGPTNEAHDPPLYYSVQRPYVEQILIPTTWQEGGLGLAGHAAGHRLEYRAYVTAGLDATGFRTLDGIRGGRTHAEESRADDLAGVGRVVVSPVAGATLGASGYFGGADQRRAGLGQVTVTLLDADARLHRGGADLRGVLAWTGVSGAGRVSASFSGPDSGETVGSQMLGWYLEGAYDVLGRGHPRPGGRALCAFARYEVVDTNRRVPSGFIANPAADRRILTSGISYYPVGSVAFKADLEHWTDRSGASLDRVNLGAAFLF
jgi:hypothetical protein